ncbi:hypothetical protein K501DRAFT_254674 [Backusella circina FSU 941]|nr:hypothetical protein K501DRAFT_254674 [Backusella circina FSU 941]
MNRTALFVGASGLIGRQAIKAVLKSGNYTKVISIGRRVSKFEDDIPQENLVQKIVDFENIEASMDDLKNINDVFFCFGTTPKTAGSWENYLKIDVEYLRNTAKAIADANRLPNQELVPVHALFCSGAGANKNSMIQVVKIKAENEEYFTEVGFERVSVFRVPAVKVTEQREAPRMSETLIEYFMTPLNWVFGNGLMVEDSVIGSAFRRVAADTSIKPANPKNIFETAQGASRYTFTGSDMMRIASEK